MHGWEEVHTAGSVAAGWGCGEGVTTGEGIIGIAGCLILKGNCSDSNASKSLSLEIASDSQSAFVCGDCLLRMRIPTSELRCLFLQQPTAG